MSLTSLGSTPQPSLAWTFESSNVDYVTNLSPTNQVSPGPAQLVGSAALVTNAPTSNTAVSFDGSSGYMNLGTSSPANFSSLVSNTFVEFWVYTNSLAVTRIYGQGNPTTSGRNYSILLNSNKFGISYGSTDLVSSTTVSAQQWYHVAVSIHTSTSVSLFVGGSLVGTSATVPSTYTSYPVVIGALNGGYFNGYIRDLRVVQGGVVPTTSFTPAAAPFSYALPSYVTGSGSVVFTLLGQFVTYPSGKFGSAISIVNRPVGSGNSNVYLSWSTSMPLSGITVVSGVTISLWVNFYVLPTSGECAVFYITSGGTGQIGLIVNPTTVYWKIGDGAGNYYIGSSTSYPVVGTWYHYTITASNGTAQLYINGALAASSVASYPLTSTWSLNNTYIGSIVTYGPTSALYDDLRIYNTALTAAQVQSIYRAQGMSSRGVQVATHLLSLIPSSPVFMQTFGTSTVPTSDLYGATLTSTGSPTMYLDATRGYVFPATGSTSLVSTFNLPVSYSKSIWVYLTGAPGTGNLLSSAVASGAIHYLYFENSYSLRAGHDASGGLVNYVTDPGTISLNQWTHYVLTYNQTTTTMILFRNGIQVASTTNAAMSWTGGNAVAMCQYGGSGTLSNGRVDNPIIYNRALTAAEVSLLYTSQINHPTLDETTAGLTYNPIQLTGTPLFSQLSSGATSSAVGAFSLRAVNGTTAKSVQVRNGTTSATQDFYADRLGNLLTAPVTGQTLANWLGGATGYVKKWYDQSGRGNDASQDTAANQPIIQKATKGPGYMVTFNGTSQFVTLSASYNFLNGTNITVNAVALRTATVTGPNYIIGTNSPTVSYQMFFLGFDSDTSIAMPVTEAPTAITIPAYNASNEPVTYMTGGITPSRVLYKNDTLGGTNVDTTLLSVPSGYSYSIGYTVGAATYYYQGNLFELLIFTSALDQTQVTQVYQNQLSYTGN